MESKERKQKERNEYTKEVVGGWKNREKKNKERNQKKKKKKTC